MTATHKVVVFIQNHECNKIVFACEERNVFMISQNLDANKNDGDTRQQQVNSFVKDWSESKCKTKMLHTTAISSMLHR